jgi:hypothetical protein
MTPAELTSPDAVECAISEFVALRRDAFLSKHGFSTARSYSRVRDGKACD